MFALIFFFDDEVNMSKKEKREMVLLIKEQKTQLPGKMQKKCHFRTLFLLVIPNRDRDLEKLSQILISYTPKIRKESLKYHFLYTAFFFILIFMNLLQNW